MSTHHTTCVLVGECSSHWETWAERLRDEYESVSLIIQWPKESQQAFAKRGVDQLATKNSEETLIYLCGEDNSRAAVAGRNRVLRAGVRADPDLRLLQLIVPVSVESILPSWAGWLAESLDASHTALTVTLRSEAATQAA